MALIVEDGSGVPGAVAFVDVEYVRAFANARARTIPAEGDEGDKLITAKIIVASDYLRGLSSRFKGDKSQFVNGLPFPRSCMVVGGQRLPDNAIPDDIKDAQAQLTLAVLDGFDLMPTLDGAEIKREKIGPIETEYVTGTQRGAGPVVASAIALLSPYYGSIVRLTTRRV